MERTRCKLVTIIVFYNAYQDCVELLSDLSETISENHRIVIVDNKSRDIEINKLQKSINHPYIHVVFNNGNYGYGSGINFGFNFAKRFNPEIVQILNADTRVCVKSYISEIIKYFEKTPDAGVISPAVKYGDGNMQNTIMQFFSLKNSITFKANQNKSCISNSPTLIKVQVLNGVCMFIRSSVFQKINGFDENFFMYGEEHDLCYRIYKNRFNCYFLPMSSLVHKESYKTINETIDWRFLLVRANQVQFLYKHDKRLQGAILSILFSIRLLILKILAKKNFNLPMALHAVLSPKWYNNYLKSIKNITA